MIFTEREKVLALADALLAEGFDVKFHAWRCNNGDRTENLLDKRTWKGGIAYTVFVPQFLVNLREASRIQAVAERFGCDAWLSTDGDDEPIVKLELNIGKRNVD